MNSFGERRIVIARGTLAALLVVGLATGCWSREESSTVVAIPEEAPADTPSVSARLPVTFSVSERSGVDRPDGALVTGVPLARGEVRDSDALRLLDRKGVLAARFTPLAKWPDASWRWVLVLSPLPIDARATRRVTLDRGAGPAPKQISPSLPSVRLELTAESGSSIFWIRESGSERRGAHEVEVDLEPLSDRRLRVRVRTAQITGDDTWRALTLKVASPGRALPASKPGAVGRGDWCATVHRAAQRGPKSVEQTGDGFLIHLYPPSAPPYPADEGFHVTHEIVLERSSSPDELALRIEAPLRASFPPGYVDATRAMGRVGQPGARSRALDRAFEASWSRIRDQMTQPRNRGWTAWGDIFDRDHTLAYYGYLNQEYDPATAFFVYYARTGNAEALDLALDMARQYADVSVSLRGGCYQHRATLHAVYSRIADEIGARIRGQWRRRSSQPADLRAILKFVGDKYGDPAAQFLNAYVTTTLRGADPARMESAISSYIGYALAESVSQDIQRDPKLARRFENRRPTMRDMVQLLLEAEEIRGFGLPSDDAIFAPVFARYGGSWEDFPAFHFYDTPIEKYTHDGSHSLAEMLVWGHLWTGDPSLRRTALRVADHHVNRGLVERAVESVNEDVQKRRPSQARVAGWPLVNLVALEVLAERMAPKLDAEIDRAMGELVRSINRLEPGQYEGSVHVAVVSEGLARYHERTGDESARRRLIELAHYWATRQWSSDGYAAQHGRSRPVGPAVTSMCLYGLAYAAWQSGDVQLAARARSVVEIAGRSQPSYVKLFAQQFRNSTRALELLDDVKDR